MNQAKTTFVKESSELLWDMEDALLRIENGGGKEDVNTLFQAAHTIREAAEFLRFTQVVSFARSVENLVRKIRDYEIKPDGKLITNLFLCCDLLRGLVNHLAHDSTGNPDAGIGGIIEYFTSVDEMEMLNCRGAGGQANHWMASRSVVGNFVNLAV